MNQREPETDGRKTELYIRQVKTLDDLLAAGAITEAQYNKSFSCMTRLMGMERVALEKGFSEKGK